MHKHLKPNSWLERGCASRPFSCCQQPGRLLSPGQSTNSTHIRSVEQISDAMYFATSMDNLYLSVGQVLGKRPLQKFWEVLEGLMQFRAFSAKCYADDVPVQVGVTKMSLQDWRCDTLGVDVGGIVVWGNPLNVRKTCSLDVLHKEVAQSELCAWNACWVQACCWGWVQLCFRWICGWVTWMRSMALL